MNFHSSEAFWKPPRRTLDRVWETLHENLHSVDRICLGIYLSTDIGARQYSRLRALGIKQILCVGKELKAHMDPRFECRYISIHDAEEEDIKQHFKGTLEWMSAKPTLVHCFAGISRSPTIVLAYLMKHYGHTLERALSICKDARPRIEPNPGFLKQLEAYEKELEESKAPPKET